MIGRAGEMMERQLANLVRLVDDLLDVSRITRGKIRAAPERLELAALWSLAPLTPCGRF